MFFNTEISVNALIKFRENKEFGQQMNLSA